MKKLLPNGLELIVPTSGFPVVPTFTPRSPRPFPSLFGHDGTPELNIIVTFGLADGNGYVYSMTGSGDVDQTERDLALLDRAPAAPAGVAQGGILYNSTWRAKTFSKELLT